MACRTNKFYHSKKFREGKSFEDIISHYALAGGIPAYWLKFEIDKSFKENLKEKILKKGEFLYNEVDFIFREELREPRFYFAILQAIAMGKRKLSEIINATGINLSSINKYLGVLSDLKIVEREVSVTDKNPLKSKKGLYKINDAFFQFWFRFIFPRKSEIEYGRIDEVLDEIQSILPQYLGQVYEIVAKDILKENTQYFFPISAIGRWWEKNEEIDIVAINRKEKAILFAEAKWSEKPVGTNILKNLIEKSKKVDWEREERKEYYCLFSKSGFTEELLKLRKDKSVLLFSNDELVMLE